MAENHPPPPEMAANHAPRTMYDYTKSSLTGIESSIFDGLQDEDPNTHLANFVEFCDTFKINDVSDDAIRLRLFPFSLRNKAKQWLYSLPRGSITTWVQMTEKVLLKYFSPAKTTKLRNDISSFVQMDLETLYDA
ncbi:RING-H2 finger protein ATL63 [Gossypium australe]|uniref:RING-H2 finger protein ATL63 n=1 Tax=Gossypium australe TaxID=47621 RepID=A0A5B6VZI9_9ROSI|nr:RING-H2 finger protein ATL63 [Gossypium australe]